MILYNQFANVTDYWVIRLWTIVIRNVTDYSVYIFFEVYVMVTYLHDSEIFPLHKF